MILGTASWIEVHKVLLKADFLVEMWKMIGLRNESTDPKILNFHRPRDHENLQN